MGVAWLDCWNYGKASSLIRQLVLQNQRVMRESLFLATPKFRSFSSNDAKILGFLDDKRMASIFADHISSALSAALEIDTRTNQMLIDLEYPALTFGYSIAISRKDDWMPEVLHPRHVAFPPNTTTTEVKKWITFSEIDADDLYNVWATKSREASELDEDSDSGERYHIADSYVLEGLEEALWANYQQKYDGMKNVDGYKDWAALQEGFQTNCRYIIQNTAVVQIAKLFNRELDGTMSETWIQYNRNEQAITAASKLIFKKNHGKVHQDDVIVVVKDSGFTNNGKIHKLRGISKMAVEDGLRYDATRNMVSNKAKMMGMPYIQTSGINNNVASSIEVTSGFGVLKAGTSFAENAPAFDLSTHLSLLNFNEREYQNMTSDFDGDVSSKLSKRPTKSEVAVVGNQAQSMEQAKATIKLADYSKVIMMLLNGLCKATMEEGDAGYKAQVVFFDILINKLKEYGVENKADAKKVIAAIQFIPIDYYGLTLDTLKTMLAIAETPQSRNRIRRMMLLRMGCPHNEVDLHAPYEPTGYRSLEDEALVAIENNMFLTTSNVVYSDSHDPISHLEGHHAQVGEIFEGVGSGEIAVTQAFKWVSNILAHSELHLRMLQNHPFYKNKFESYYEAQRNLTRNAMQLMEMAEKEQKQAAQQEIEQQQQGQDLDPVQAAKIQELQVKAQAKAEREQFLTKTRMEVKAQQRQFDNQLKVEDQQFNQQLKEQQAAQDRRINLMKAAQKMMQ